MRIALINGSPKSKDGASEALIERFIKSNPKKIDCICLKLNKQEINEENVQALDSCDAWIFFFPIYVDGIPGHLLSCLQQLELLKDNFESKFICAVTNCGYADGEQGELSINILKHWTKRAGHMWGGGIGIGEGGALPELLNHKLYRYPRYLIGNKFKQIAKYIKEHQTFENIFISGGIPMMYYKLATERYWHKRLRKNGKKRKDIGLAL